MTYSYMVVSIPGCAASRGTSGRTSAAGVGNDIVTWRGRGPGFRLTIAIFVLEGVGVSTRGPRRGLARVTYKQGESLLELGHLFLSESVGLIHGWIALAERT